MRWYEAVLHESVQTGTDVLGNPVYELRGTDRAILVRTAPRGAVRNRTEGNQFSVEERTLITCAAAEAIEGAAAIEVGGVLYDIVGISSREGPISLRARRCKGGGLPDC
ncbi:hypothetical protein EII22_08990 [Coriobacteriales bacterium OH1046]|nr:hypothetical protein EII22_08990 [Coriobacteriales bacterium OH1046]